MNVFIKFHGNPSTSYWNNSVWVKVVILLFNVQRPSSCVLQWRHWSSTKLGRDPLQMSAQWGRRAQSQLANNLFPSIFKKPLLGLAYCLFSAPNWKPYHIKQRHFKATTVTVYLQSKRVQVFVSTFSNNNTRVNVLVLPRVKIQPWAAFECNCPQLLFL